MCRFENQPYLPPLRLPDAGFPARRTRLERAAFTAALRRVSEKGLAALSAIPEGLSATVGSSLVKASVEAGPNWSGIGDLVGGVLGGFTKTITGG